MIELTAIEQKQLEKRVMEQLSDMYPDDGGPNPVMLVSQAAVRATILTLCEYDRLKAEQKTDR